MENQSPNSEGDGVSGMAANESVVVQRRVTVVVVGKNKLRSHCSLRQRKERLQLVLLMPLDITKLESWLWEAARVIRGGRMDAPNQSASQAAWGALAAVLVHAVSARPVALSQPAVMPAIA